MWLSTEEIIVRIKLSIAYKVLCINVYSIHEFFFIVILLMRKIRNERKDVLQIWVVAKIRAECGDPLKNSMHPRYTCLSHKLFSSISHESSLLTKPQTCILLFLTLLSRSYIRGNSRSTWNSPILCYNFPISQNWEMFSWLRYSSLYERYEYSFKSDVNNIHEKWKMITIYVAQL